MKDLFDSNLLHNKENCHESVSRRSFSSPTGYMQPVNDICSSVKTEQNSSNPCESRWVCKSREIKSYDVGSDSKSLPYGDMCCSRVLRISGSKAEDKTLEGCSNFSHKSTTFPDRRNILREKSSEGTYKTIFRVKRRSVNRKSVTSHCVTSSPGLEQCTDAAEACGLQSVRHTHNNKTAKYRLQNVEDTENTNFVYSNFNRLIDSISSHSIDSQACDLSPCSTTLERTSSLEFQNDIYLKPTGLLKLRQRRRSKRFNTASPFHTSWLKIGRFSLLELVVLLAVLFCNSGGLVRMGAEAEVIFHRRDHRDQGLYASDRRELYQVDSINEAKVYLSKYGYLNNCTVDSARVRRSLPLNIGQGFAEESPQAGRAKALCTLLDVERALKKLQASFDLRPSGRLDRATKSLMSRGRCGNSDTEGLSMPTKLRKIVDNGRAATYVDRTGAEKAEPSGGLLFRIKRSLNEEEMRKSLKRNKRKKRSLEDTLAGQHREITSSDLMTSSHESVTSLTNTVMKRTMTSPVQTVLVVNTITSQLTQELMTSQYTTAHKAVTSLQHVMTSQSLSSISPFISTDSTPVSTVDSNSVLSSRDVLKSADSLVLEPISTTRTVLEPISTIGNELLIDTTLDTTSTSNSYITSLSNLNTHRHSSPTSGSNLLLNSESTGRAVDSIVLESSNSLIGSQTVEPNRAVSTTTATTPTTTKTTTIATTTKEALNLRTNLRLLTITNVTSSAIPNISAQVPQSSRAVIFSPEVITRYGSERGPKITPMPQIIPIEGKSDHSSIIRITQYKDYRTKHETTKNTKSGYQSITEKGRHRQRSTRTKRSISIETMGDITEGEDGTKTKFNKDENSPVNWRLLEDNLSGKIPLLDQAAILELAFRMWSEVIPLKFHEASAMDIRNIDVVIGFAKQNHMNCDKPFDGHGGELAHSWTAGDIHFDEDENYKRDDPTGSGINLLKVAVHEIGHVLGLLHNERDSSIMYPVYVNPSMYDDFELSREDRSNVQNIYGLCKGTFDVVFDWLRKLPSTDPSRRWRYIFNTYFFRDSRYWMYENKFNRTRYGDPLYIERGWSGLEHPVDAFTQVITADAEQEYIIDTYFFRGDKYYKYDDDHDIIAADYPRNISDDFGPKPGQNESIPNDLNGVMFDNRDSLLYFFKDEWVWVYNPKLIGKNGCCELKIKFSELFPFQTQSNTSGVTIPPPASPLDNEDVLEGNIDTVFYSYHHNAVFFFKGESVYRNTAFGTVPRRNALKRQDSWYHMWYDICDVE